MKKITVLAILSFYLCLGASIGEAFGQRLGGRTNQRTNQADQPQRNMGIGSRLFFGGNIGGFFSGNYGQLQLSPIIGYYLTPKVSVGGGPTYEFYFFDRVIDNLKVNLFGGRAFARMDVMENLFAHGEFEYTRYSDSDDNKGNLTRLPVGGGYRQRLGGRSTFNMMVLYDVLYQANRDSDNYGFLRDSGYNGFIFRFGVNLGI